MNVPQATIQAFIDTLINISVMPFTNEQLAALDRGDASAVTKGAKVVARSLLEVQARRLKVVLNDDTADLLLHMGRDVGGATMLLMVVTYLRMVNDPLTDRVNRISPTLCCQDVVTVWDGVPVQREMDNLWNLCSNWLYRLPVWSLYGYTLCDIMHKAGLMADNLVWDHLGFFEPRSMSDRVVVIPKSNDMFVNARTLKSRPAGGLFKYDPKGTLQ